MARSENQKLKLLYLLKYLSEESDEQHPLSTRVLIEKLAADGIAVERKTIYSDIQALCDFGYDILQDPSRQNGGYYLASRDFELAELKMLVDMVQASRFLSVKKSRELIKKLEGMAGRYEAGEMQRSVYVAERAKSSNESIYYAVDAIHRAISHRKGITFRYMEYTVDKAWQLKRGGGIYRVSPWYLMWNNENYYLIGFDEQREEIRHYRVDRMKELKEAETARMGGNAFAGFDIASYSKQAFNMFDGKERKLTLECANSLASVIVDRFGDDIILRREGEDRFRVNVTVSVSRQFYGWLAGLGGEIVIASPKKEADAYREYLQKLLDDSV
ncbi:MAG: WYL domain-containing protein [Lachnospiraceae bacterium]|nr:WYL domain-containing protein [Lachnospiraceae bacterium]